MGMSRTQLHVLQAMARGQRLVSNSGPSVIWLGSHSSYPKEKVRLATWDVLMEDGYIEVIERKLTGVILYGLTEKGREAIA